MPKFLSADSPYKMSAPKLLSVPGPQMVFGAGTAALNFGSLLNPARSLPQHTAPKDMVVLRLGDVGGCDDFFYEHGDDRRDTSLTLASLRF